MVFCCLKCCCISTHGCYLSMSHCLLVNTPPYVSSAHGLFFSSLLFLPSIIASIATNLLAIFRDVGGPRLAIIGVQNAPVYRSTSMICPRAALPSDCDVLLPFHPYVLPQPSIRHLEFSSYRRESRDSRKSSS